MLSVGNKYMEAVSADSRNMPYRITLESGVVLDRSKVTNVLFDESTSDTSGLSIGTANSATLKFTLKDAEALDYNGMKVVAESGLELSDGFVQWVPLGEFWVTDFSTSNDFKTVDFTCADGMYLMSGEYESELTYPAPIEAVAKEIASKAGVELIELSPWPDVVVRRKPEKMALRTAIGYAAGCCGRNARFNRLGKLEFTWYKNSGVVIPRETQYLNGMTKLSHKPLKVKFEITGQKELYTVNVISDGNGGITATPGEKILEGDNVVLSVNPFADYELATISAVNESGSEVTLYRNAEGGYTFVQPDSDVTVVVSFRKSANGPFNLTVRAYDGGTIEYEASGHSAGDSYFNEGDEVIIHITPDEGKQIDKVVTTPRDIDLTQNSFVMPKSDVTITVFFKDLEEVITPYSWLQRPVVPPTNKPYWAVFYKDDPNLPTCQKYYLVWFDSWSATLYDTAYDLNEYKIQLNGYYYCGSKNNGNGSHEWDNSTWTGNGDASSNVKWNSYVGFMWSGADSKRVDEQWCLLVSNVPLYHGTNGRLLFEANDSEITDIQTSYIQDGADVRERSSLSYWMCPDTFSTPLPSQNWMVLMPESGLYMTINAEGKYTTPLTSFPNTMIVLFYDSITIQNIGAVDSSSSEEFYIVSVTNGRWAYLRAENIGWGELYELPEGAVIGFRNPLISTESKYVYNDGNGYQFSGVLATNSTLYVGGEVFMHNNACRVCDCVSEVAEVSTFSLLRSRSVTDAIVIQSEDVTVTTEGNTIVLSGPFNVSTSGESICLTFSSDDVEQVTLSYTNPFIYEKMVPAISELVKDITYTPAKIKHRGNPALQAGDIVMAPDKDGVYHAILVMQQTMTFGGGMNSEISCPGKTEKTTSFSSNSPMTTQIKNAVSQSSFELERRMATNNALVYASLYKTIGTSEAKIASVVEWQTEKAATIAKIEQSASANEAKIALVVGEKGLVNDEGAVQGSIVIQAINGESTAKISADRLDIVGKKLNIKVDATNIEGKLKAEQIEAEVITVGTLTADKILAGENRSSVTFYNINAAGGKIAGFDISDKLECVHTNLSADSTEEWRATSTIAPSFFETKGEHIKEGVLKDKVSAQMTTQGFKTEIMFEEIEGVDYSNYKADFMTIIVQGREYKLCLNETTMAVEVRRV